MFNLYKVESGRPFYLLSSKVDHGFLGYNKQFQEKHAHRASYNDIYVTMRDGSLVEVWVIWDRSFVVGSAELGELQDYSQKSRLWNFIIPQNDKRYAHQHPGYQGHRLLITEKPCKQHKNCRCWPECVSSQILQKAVFNEKYLEHKFPKRGRIHGKLINLGGVYYFLEYLLGYFHAYTQAGEWLGCFGFETNGTEKGFRVLNVSPPNTYATSLKGAVRAILNNRLLAPFAAKS